MLLLSGELDPVGGEDAVQATALAQLFTERGLPVEQHVYPEARHEVFNETNRDEVVADLMAWLDARLGGASAGLTRVPGTTPARLARASHGGRLPTAPCLLGARCDLWIRPAIACRTYDRTPMPVHRRQGRGAPTA